MIDLNSCRNEGYKTCKIQSRSSQEATYDQRGMVRCAPTKEKG